MLAKTQYPFVVSTKGRLVVEQPYLHLLSECNCVVQISAVCSRYDILEPGAPCFEERLDMIRILSKNVKRVIVRIQPYMCEVFEDVRENIRRFSEAGAYGIILEGMKFIKKKQGLEKVGGDFVFPIERLKMQFNCLRQTAHESGLKFYVGENRLRGMGDNLTCCGIDGLDGFVPNEFNLCHMLNGAQPQATDAMKRVGSARCLSAINQNTVNNKRLDSVSLRDAILDVYREKPDYYKKIFGK